MPEAAPAPQQDITQARRLALAFQNVFGQPVRRSADQTLVVEHLRAMCGRDTAIFQAAPGQPFDALRAAHKDGAQTQYLIIKRQLATARKFALGPKPKVKVKKKPNE